MLALAVEIAQRGFLLKIEDLDRLIAIPEKIISAIEQGELPEEIVVNGKVRRLVTAGMVDKSKINLKIGSRLALSGAHPEFAFIIELVRGVVQVAEENSAHTILDDLIFKQTSFAEFLELSKNVR